MTKIDVYKPTRMLSAGSASELTFWVRQKLDEGARHLLIDLKTVMFMDSSGLGCLVAARRMAQENEASFALCSLNGQAQMLFEMAGVQGLFTIVEDLEDYRNFLQQQASPPILESAQPCC